MSDNDILYAYQAAKNAWITLLFGKVAKRLTARPVEVRHFPPPIDARGLTLKSDSGTGAIVYLSPDLDDEQRLHTFLHECAHVALHFEGLAKECDLARVAEVRDQNGDYVPERILNARYKKHEEREVQANALMQTWLQSCASETTLQKKLLQLLE